MPRQLFFLDQSRGAVMTAREDGSDLSVLANNCPHPDGIVVDVEGGYLYWTNMGRTFGEANGSIECSRLDGSERKTIISEGVTRTPKQLRLDVNTGHIYWCDREGMRVMRANVDGSDVETLVSAGNAEVDQGDATRWCVGIALDLARRYLYWTQKGPPNGGLGRIFRAPMDHVGTRNDPPNYGIAPLIEGLPEPVDLELSADGDWLYWTDRSHGLGGGSVYCARINWSDNSLGKPHALMTGLDQPIGLAFDADANRLFVADLGGNVHAGDIARNLWRRILSYPGRFTGICFS